MGAAALGKFNDTATEMSANSFFKLRIDSRSHDGTEVVRLKRVSEQHRVDRQSQRRNPICRDILA
ncbi:hypothetical protein VI03_22975 [Burkholderia vietnamiensis]|uniref:Uncharacterized protein n=1 Tax=Burkholderia ubonensis TaxID=101571 RepID=A0A1B4LIE1_9BURK|nr:hypothetical protein WJ02_27075 [Burkholderia vietnamiensis]AOJ76865.1 hypothetical protein WJ35_17585 [Burkholderia ubonensis]AOK02451.1 hypothetical protein WK23_27585 [Burkholderia vietnamiensis]AOK13962.1 hypothetical protein WK31_27045 [Burkholderia vietnamiensis]KKI36526.1 hypothetical protein VI03_22975 [Burkholderia vietnamiensis]